MLYSSQKNPLWSNKYLGFSKTKIGTAGCFITSISNLLAYNGETKTPSEINDIAKKCGAFTGDMLNAGILAKALGYGYVKAIKPPVSNCIVETNYYAKMGFSQHFVFFNPRNGKRVDPLDLSPGFEPNNYPIISYRLFLKLEQKIQTPDLVSIPEKIVTKIQTPEPTISESNTVTPPKLVEPTVTAPDAPQTTPQLTDKEIQRQIAEIIEGNLELPWWRKILLLISKLIIK